MAARRLAGAKPSLRAAVRAVIRRITWRVAGAALALGVGMNVWLTAEIALYLAPQQSLAMQSASTLLISLVMTFSLMFTTFVADEFVADGTSPIPAYGWAVVTGSASGALVQWSIHYALGIPIDLYTPIFAVSRISGWTAHVLEQYANNRLIRPRADYTGPSYPQRFTPLEQR